MIMAPNGDFLSSCRIPPIGYQPTSVQSRSTLSPTSEEKQRIKRCLFGPADSGDTQRMFARENEKQMLRMQQLKTIEVESVHDDENIKNLPNCNSKELERPAIEEATSTPVHQSRSESTRNGAVIPCTPIRKRQSSMSEYYPVCKLKNKVKSVENCPGDSNTSNKSRALSTSIDSKPIEKGTTSAMAENV